MGINRWPNLFGKLQKNHHLLVRVLGEFLNRLGQQVFLVASGVVLSPILHRFFYKMHLDTAS